MKVGLIGAGKIGRVHAEAVRKSGIGKIIRIYDPSPALAGVAKEFDASVAESADEIFHDETIEAVIIASPTDTHADYLRNAILSKKHVFCEKPVARTREQLDELHEIATGYNRIVTVGHVLRFTPEYVRLKKMVDEKALGQIGTIRFGRACNPSSEEKNWRNDFTRSGGASLDLMIHDLDALQWCFGEIERLFAMRAETVAPGADFVVTVAKLKSGAIAHLEASWLETPMAFHYYYEITGSKGLLEYDSRSQPMLSVYEKQPSKAESFSACSNPSFLTPYEAQMNDFLQACREQRPPRVSLDDGIKATRYALSVIDSSSANRVMQNVANG
jgi:predicted dehydrogenase